MALPKKMVSPTVLAVGYRGTAFVSGLIAGGLPPLRVVSYGQVGDQSNAFDELSRLCRAHEIPLETTRRPDLTGEPLVFLVGWQFMLSGDLQRCVVFHDSLLPRLRGFSPTVTALLR